jgi:uncharacterized protein (DUF608 family)
MSFRTVYPPGEYFMGAAAADGQMGTIMRAYREWKYSGDTEWLEVLWPAIKRALEFAWLGTGENAEYSWERPYHLPWDPDREGILRTRQHNTYDIDFFGPNMYTGALYTGALKAAAEMAGHLGDTLKAREYSELAELSAENYEKLLWNGNYYVQIPEIYEERQVPEVYLLRKGDTSVLRYQYQDGCLSDQLLGQFLADVSGLGDLFDTARINRSLKSVFDHNFIPDFSNYQNVQRIYAANNESGLVLCSWPLGEEPDIPFVYSQEVWTGVEYQVASQLIRRGFTDEGLRVVKSVRDRYRGFNRNPLAEIESGRFYARALSSWGLLSALSGYHYNGVEKSIHFDPVLNKKEFKTLWTGPDGWGILELAGKTVKIRILYGHLELRRIILGYPDEAEVAEINQPHDYTSQYKDGRLSVEFERSLQLGQGDEWFLVLKTR